MNRAIADAASTTFEVSRPGRVMDEIVRRAIAQDGLRVEHCLLRWKYGYSIDFA